MNNQKVIVMSPAELEEFMDRMLEKLKKNLPEGLNKAEGDSNPDLIPKAVLARELNTSLGTIRRWELDGKIKGRRLPGSSRVYFLRSDIYKLL